MIFKKIEFAKYYRFQGRRVSKKLSPAKVEIYKNLFYQFSFDNEIIQYLESKKSNFNLKNKHRLKKTVIEVGFGNGENLIKQAKLNTDFFYFGSEVFVNGIVNVLKEIKNNDLKNVNLSQLNFSFLLDIIKPDTVDHYYILNPDPWEKKRHHKRRLLNIENIIKIYRSLKKQGSITIITDSDSYRNQIELSINANSSSLDFVQIQEIEATDPLYGSTNYQRKAIANKKKIYKIQIFRN